MWASRSRTSSPSLFIKPRLLLRHAHSTARSTLLIPPPRLLCSGFSCRRAVATVAAMDGAKADAGQSPPEHVAGNWYSVPELRLRDHYFTVPLDYSLDRRIFPKISVFAREVVAVSSMLQMKSAEDLANYLKHFRADNIVNDAEFIRKYLVPDAGTWTVLGQSYGGFCAVTYLSFAPEGLKQVLLTGGIPPVGSGCTADAVYRACFEPIIHQNEKYYKRFPQDIEIVHEVVNHLAESERGGFEKWLAFDTNPLYALLHESIYCQGASSRWSAHRIMAEDGGRFDAIQAAKVGRPVLFTGEMIFPWMFEEIHALRHFKDAAHLLAKKKDWPPLYDIASLNNNKVPVAAAVYYEDMFVNFKLAMETASQIAGIRLWITNEYMHSGLRDGGGQVFDHLTGMLNGKKPLF
ncbi:alpha/beta-Hydrolases superfamily protein [Actinidia rufa]|uniref:Alpha/beta-Hydrolases superfamily protein n=1 Tax=Actinidia rufa TaxID=165716 RepID=A0A7J0FF97_9ERIC|nr:alpha/beta-Hydrolases superfamily protein [Actinidia rufa]